MATFILILASFIAITVAEIDLDICGRELSCYRSPKDCKSEKECDFIITWKDNDKTKKSAIQMYVKNQQYLIMGLSKDTKEGEDTLFSCQKNQNESPKVKIYFLNTDKKLEEILNYGSGISNENNTYGSDFIRCMFERNDTFANFSKKVYDIKSNKATKYYLYSYQGNLQNGKLPDQLTNSTHTITKIDFTKVVNIIGNKVKASPLVKAHGCLMVIAWMLFAPTGIFTARYFQKFLDEEEGEEDTWYYIHIFCMGMVFICTVIAFVLIFVEAGSYVKYESNPEKSHPILGLIIFSLCLANPIVAAIRGVLTPEKSDDNREIFNWIHKLIGISIGFLSFINIMLGTLMPKANVSDTLIWWILVNLILHSINAIILDLMQCGEDKDSQDLNTQELSADVVKPTTEKRGSEDEGSEGKPETKEERAAKRKNTRNTMYGGMIALSIGISIRVIVAIATD